MSVKPIAAALAAVVVLTGAALAQTAPTQEESIQEALEHVQQAEAILAGLLDTTTTTTTTAPPPTTAPPASNFTPLPLTIRNDIPNAVATWRDDFHPDASGVRHRIEVTNGTPALSVLLDVAGTDFTDALVSPGQPTHEHQFIGVVPTVLSPFDYWAQPGWGTQRPYAIDDNGNPVAQTPGVWMPLMYTNGNPVELTDQIPVYYECSDGTVAPGRRAHMIPAGAGFVTFDHTIKTVNGKWRINFFGPIGFHESLQTGPISTPTENHDKFWWPGMGPLPPESEGWFATPQVEVYWKTRIDANVDFPAQVSFGGPNTNIPPHMDYVSGSTPVGDTFALQIVEDWACNQPGGKHSLHALNLSN
jgi:hypothetical protein